MNANGTKIRLLTAIVVLTVILGPLAGPGLADDGIATLRQTSKAFSKVAKKAIPAVVSIEVEKAVKRDSRYGYSSPFGPGSPFFDDELFERFFGRGMRQRRPQKPRVWRGSGFIVSSDGYIMTNNHVVENVDKITVTLNNGTEYKGSIVGTDPKSEVAVIKIDGRDFPTVELGDSDALEIGEWVIAVGNPFGLAETVTVGVVSAKGRKGFGIIQRDPVTGEIGYENFIQTDAAINPGNSGGPLLNLDGEVIGINTFIVSGSGGYMGIGFAIPINMAKVVKNQLIKSGKITRGYLGIYMDNLTAEKAKFFDLEQTYGVIITNVVEDSPADEAKLHKDDIILKIDGQDVQDPLNLRNTIAFLEPGTNAKLLVYRDGRELEINVKIGAKPEYEFAKGVSEIAKKLGLQVQNLTDELAKSLGYEPGEGVVVSSVTRGSEADKKDIEAGMIILSVNRKHVSSVEQFNAALEEKIWANEVLLLLRYDRYHGFYVVLSLD